jgi:phosphate starvation-inducible PhoH-like protein
VLETRDLVDQIWAGHHHRFELPLLRRPVHFQPRDVPMDAYALGLLLGDGCLTGPMTPSFATQDPELAALLDEALDGVEVRANEGVGGVGNRVGGGRGGAVVMSPVTAVLRGLELWGTGSSTRFVPECYLYNAADVRLAVLQGLLDTDGGHVTQVGRTCRIQYVTTSSRLRDDVLFLVRSLGGVADSTRVATGRTTGRANGREADRADAHILDIRLPGGMEPFRLPRKQALYRRSGGGRPTRFLHSIEPAGTAEAVCIRVAAPDSLYVTEDFLLTHNTLNDAFIVADEAQNTTAEQMKMFLTRIGFNSKAVVTGDISQVDLPAGKRSGLRIVRDILTGIEGVSFCYLTAGDVVRHHIVQRIVEAYEAYDEEQERDMDGRAGASPGDGER